ncbi:MAG: 16S rRNA (guanine(527)-N(7))-methyltransferase RsmG [Candidatus Shikimatogenerans bostrichidophilus]|nr:MAG: 16S rRNA (guanine(527)-N(7))-methyltransferase RsmG [Candidatus Shikimatogenerans bostrichidophilus]
MKIINNNIRFYKNDLNKFKYLKKIHTYYNKKINLISTNSLNNFYLNHIEYSLSIINLIKFLPNSEIMDAGTGGGFPGIPLSIIFKNTKFYLVDSINKKILILKKIIKILNINNVYIINNRIENIKKKFDFVISRYLTNINNIYNMFKNNIKKKSNHYLKNGIIYLTGVKKNNIKIKKYYIRDLYSIYKNDFYFNKKIIYIPII